MCEPTTIGLALGASASSAAAVGTMAYVGAASVAMQAYQGEQTRKGQSAAQSQARTDADQNMNRVNPKLPNVTDLGRANFNATSGGSGSTMLTGPAGVAPNNMLLGRSTLLGG